MNLAHRTCLASLGGLLTLVVACEPPECIDGPSNLTAESTATCDPLPDDIELDPQIVSAGAEMLDDGGLVLTWSSNGLQCGTRATDISPPDDCTITGWTLTAEVPAELVRPGTIELATHPEVLGTLTVTHDLDGISTGSFGNEPFLVGQLELVSVADGCVTGVLHGFGSGSGDPILGGPELDGGFVAPVCER